jgi:hypothetical protein
MIPARELIGLVELELGPEVWLDAGRRREKQFDYEGRAVFDANLIAGKEVRYSLSAVWDEAGPMLFGMGLNPSKARAKCGDSTVDRVLALARSKGYGSLFWINLGAQMETNAALFVRGGRQPGELNSEQLRRVLQKLHPREQSRDLLIAWGWLGPKVSKWLSASTIAPKVRLLTIGALKKGRPPHPQRYEGELDLHPLTLK